MKRNNTVFIVSICLIFALITACSKGDLQLKENAPENGLKLIGESTKESDFERFNNFYKSDVARLFTKDGGMLFYTVLNNTDVYGLRKLTRNGNEVWSKNILTNDDLVYQYPYLQKTDILIGQECIELIDGSIIIAGTLAKNAINNEPGVLSVEYWASYIVKLNGDGNIVWRKELENNNMSTKELVTFNSTADGGAIIIESSCSVDLNLVSDGKSGYYWHIIKLDEFGQQEWKKTNEHIQLVSEESTIIQKEGGGFLLATFPRDTETGGSGSNSVIFVLDENGDVINNINLNERIRIPKFLKANDNGYILRSCYFSGETISLSKLNENDEFVWRKNHQFYNFSTYDPFYFDKSLNTGYVLMYDRGDYIDGFIKFNNSGNIVE